MKLLKYILIAIVFAATAGEAFGQVKVLSGKVTEMFGATAEPMVGVNVNILNSQNPFIRRYYHKYGRYLQLESNQMKII